MKVIVFIVLVVGFATNINAQTIYGEFLGNSAGLYSVNYEHRLSTSGKNVWSLHGGFGMYNVKDAYDHISVPIGVTYYNRKEGNTHKEIGLSLTYVEGLADNRHTWGSEGVQYSKALVLVPNVGYRYQKPDGGFMFKIYYSPA